MPAMALIFLPDGGTPSPAEFLRSVQGAFQDLPRRRVETGLAPSQMVDQPTKPAGSGRVARGKMSPAKLIFLLCLRTGNMGVDWLPFLKSIRYLPSARSQFFSVNG